MNPCLTKPYARSPNLSNTSFTPHASVKLPELKEDRSSHGPRRFKALPCSCTCARRSHHHSRLHDRRSGHQCTAPWPDLGANAASPRGRCSLLRFGLSVSLTSLSRSFSADWPVHPSSWARRAQDGKPVPRRCPQPFAFVHRYLCAISAASDTLALRSH